MNYIMENEVTYVDLHSLICGKRRNVRKKSKWKKRFNILFSNFRFFIMDLIMMINGIDKDDYFFGDGITTNISFKFNKKFKEFSCLNFDSDEKGEMNSLKFRARFATLILFYFMKNIDRIVDKIYEKSEKDGDEYKHKYTILSEIIKRLNSFVVTFLSKNGEYKEHLDSLIEVIMITDKDGKDAGKIMKIYETQSEFVKVACKSHEYDEDLMINNIIKLSFVMATEKTKLKNCPKYKEGITTNNRNEVRSQIKKLGKAILRERRNEKPNFYYKLFTKSIPLYYSSFEDINDEHALNVGTKALMYLRFLMDDKNVSKYIDKMVNG